MLKLQNCLFQRVTIGWVRADAARAKPIHSVPVAGEYCNNRWKIQALLWKYPHLCVSWLPAPMSKNLFQLCTNGFAYCLPAPSQLLPCSGHNQFPSCSFWTFTQPDWPLFAIHVSVYWCLHVFSCHFFCTNLIWPNSFNFFSVESVVSPTSQLKSLT